MERIEAARSSKPKGCSCSDASEHVNRLRRLSKIEDLEQVEQILRLVSDTNRIRLLKLLLGSSPLCVCEISMALEIDQTLTSHHLGNLRSSGLVTGTRQGRWVHYVLTDKETVSSLISVIEKLGSNLYGLKEG